jgi:hypothetical protein
MNMGFSDRLVQEKKALDGRCAPCATVAAWAGLNGMIEAGGDVFEPLPWELPKGKHSAWGYSKNEDAARCSGLTAEEFVAASEDLKKRGVVKDGPPGGSMVFMGFTVMPH